MLEDLGLVAENQQLLPRMAQNSVDPEDSVNSLIRRRIVTALVRQCVLKQPLNTAWLKSQGLANILEPLQQICTKVHLCIHCTPKSTCAQVQEFAQKSCALYGQIYDEMLGQIMEHHSCR